MTTELADFVEIDGNRFPRVGTVEELKKIGARHLKTDNFRIDGVDKTIEYMIIESRYIAVWKKLSSNENYELHLLAPRVLKFS